MHKPKIERNRGWFCKGHPDHFFPVLVSVCFRQLAAPFYQCPPLGIRYNTFLCPFKWGDSRISFQGACRYDSV